MTARISGPKRARIGGHFRAAVLAMAAVLVTAGAPIVLVSCGTADDPKEYREKVAQKIIEAATPSAENFAEWRGAWVKDSWILALKRDEPALRSKESLALHLVKGLSSRFGSQLLPDELATLGGFLSERIEVELLDIANLERPAAGAITRQDIFGFGFVRFKDGEDVFARLLDASHDALPTEEFERARSAVAAQFESLSAIRGIAWAEPNLEGEVQDTRPKLSAWTPPDEFTIDSDISRLLKSIKYDKAMEALDGRQAREIVVAVVDTGVDSGSPELEGRIFVNEKEKNGKPFVDDDGNGYVDDIHGYDATVEKGKIDSSISPVPGSADLGGPGKKCPVGDVESGGRPDSCGHGTHVAGIIAAHQGLDGHWMGVCQACKIVSLRVSKRCLQPLLRNKGMCVAPVNPFKSNADDPSKSEYDGNGKIEDIAQVRALGYILDLVKPGTNGLYTHVVNLSLGKYFYNRAMALLVRRLREFEVTVVAAAGNDNTETPMYPAGYSSVLATCATSDSPDLRNSEAPEFLVRGRYAKTDFSNFGDWVDVCAPGARIPSVVPGTRTFEDCSGECEKSGTSQAGPMVAGAAGLIRSYFPGIGAQEVYERIKNYSNPDALYSQPNNSVYGGKVFGTNFYLLGGGFLDLENAVKRQKLSYAVKDESLGLTRQIEGGCVVGSVAAHRSRPVWSVMTSMPFVLMQFLLVIRLIGFIERRKRSRQ